MNFRNRERIRKKPADVTRRKGKKKLGVGKGKNLHSHVSQ